MPARDNCNESIQCHYIYWDLTMALILCYVIVLHVWLLREMSGGHPVGKSILNLVMNMNSDCGPFISSFCVWIHWKPILSIEAPCRLDRTATCTCTCTCTCTMHIPTNQSSHNHMTLYMYMHMLLYMACVYMYLYSRYVFMLHLYTCIHGVQSVHVRPVHPN